MESEHAATAGPFAGLSLAAAARQLREGATDPVELVRRSLDAIAVAQPEINAFVTVDAEGALAVARQARDELARGEDHGPLHGIPVAVKDIVDTAGLRTTMGSRHFKDHVPERDATIVTRLRSAGAVIVGKTTTHEFAYGPTGDRTANGPGANPRDRRRMAGGSSAGSAAAVGAGLVPLAIGTDTGGSVRIPAALCGVAGIRPSTGRIPTDGVFPLSWSLDSVGPLAADVEGVTIGWEVLTGDRARDPAPEPGSLRIGVPTGAWFNRLDETVHSAFTALVRRLEEQGAYVVPMPVPDVDELVQLYRTVASAEAVAVHHERMATAPELFDPEVAQRLQAAAEVPAYVYARALRRLASLRASAADRFAGFDLLLHPTVPVPAPLIGSRDTDIGGGWTSPRDALLALTMPWSVLALPSMSIPIPSPGLPVGAQLVTAPGSDARLLAVARTIERLCV